MAMCLMIKPSLVRKSSFFLRRNDRDKMLGSGLLLWKSIQAVFSSMSGSY